MSTSECREVSFGYFWVRFLETDRETCQKKPIVLQNENFFEQNFEKTSIFENFDECQIQNAVERWVLGILEGGFRGSIVKHV